MRSPRLQIGQKKNNRSTPGTRQEGVTLVIALVMLASVTFISFSLSTIILREIAAAQLILKTEPAINAADAGGEVGLYQVLRQTGNTVTTGTLAQSGASYQVVENLYANPYTVVIAAGQGSQVALYDPTNPNNLNANYSRVTVTVDHPSTVTIYSLGDLSNPICGTPVNDSGTFTCNPLTPQNGDGRYFIVINPTGNQAVNVQVTALPNGVPAVSPNLNVTGNNGSVQRKIQIDLNPAP
jgi:Tfp pilus assembly protein PilX